MFYNVKCFYDLVLQRSYCSARLFSVVPIGVVVTVCQSENSFFLRNHFVRNRLRSFTTEFFGTQFNGRL